MSLQGAGGDCCRTVVKYWLPSFPMPGLSASEREVSLGRAPEVSARPSHATPSAVMPLPARDRAWRSRGLLVVARLSKAWARSRRPASPPYRYVCVGEEGVMGMGGLIG